MPTELNTAKTFFLISAIINICFAVFWTVYVVIMGLFTCGIGCLFFILPAINIFSCVMDFIAYNKLNSLSQPGTFSSVQFAAILDIVSFLTSNFISLTFGIITLVYLNNENVKSFLRERRIY